MRKFLSCCGVVLTLSWCAAALPIVSWAQADAQKVAAVEIPDSPQAQVEIAEAMPFSGFQNAGSAEGSTPAVNTGQNQHAKAEAEMKEQEKQRVLGIVPSFNVSYRDNAVSLNAAQKMRLAFRSAVDPVTFAAAFVVAGYHEGMHDDVGFPWGIRGYGERSGAAYLDAFNGTMIGNGILPAVLHQDPRYFRMGHGTFTRRVLYALATNVVCKHDNTGKWEPNYSNIGGNIASGAISNLYYPSSGNGVGQMFTNGMVVIAEGGLGSLFQEFWPDVSRKFLHRDPTHGLDKQ